MREGSDGARWVLLFMSARRRRVFAQAGTARRRVQKWCLDGRATLSIGVNVKMDVATMRLTERAWARGPGKQGRVDEAG